MASIKFDIKTVPSYVKGIIAAVPSVIIALLVIFLVVSPNMKRIKALEGQIDQQNNEILVSNAKAAKLDVLKAENERLVKRINELKELLPEEKEISNLLKQVSDMGTAAGLEIKSWKPAAKTTHPSGIVYQIPVAVDVIGTYHNFGFFLSNITRLNRIVNINDMKLGSPSKIKGVNVLQVSFKASTFSAVPDAEAAKTPEQAGQKK